MSSEPLKEYECVNGRREQGREAGLQQSGEHVWGWESLSSNYSNTYFKTCLWTAVACGPQPMTLWFWYAARTFISLSLLLTLTAIVISATQLATGFINTCWPQWFGAEEREGLQNDAIRSCGPSQKMQIPALQTLRGCEREKVCK